jgi:hypothetical protein
MAKDPKPDFEAMDETEMLRWCNGAVRQIRAAGLPGYRESTAFKDRQTGIAFCKDRWSALKAIASWRD